MPLFSKVISMGGDAIPVPSRQVLGRRAADFTLAADQSRMSFFLSDVVSHAWYLSATLHQAQAQYRIAEERRPPCIIQDSEACVSVRLAARPPFVTPSILFVSGLYPPSAQTSWRTRSSRLPGGGTLSMLVAHRTAPLRYHASFALSRGLVISGY
jgi:hypothetical protein